MARRRLEQRAHPSATAMLLRHEIAGDAPGVRDVTPWLQLARGAERRVLGARRDRAPGDRFAVGVGDEAGLGARAHPRAQRRFAAFGGKRMEVAPPQAPEHAPAVEIAAARAEEALEVAPALRGNWPYCLRHRPGSGRRAPSLRRRRA